MGAARPDIPDNIAARFFSPPSPPSVGPPPQPAQPVGLPPHYFMPAYGAQGIYGFDTATVGPAASWTVPAGVKFQVPPNNVAVIRSWGFSVNNLNASSNISGNVRVGGTALAPTRRIPPVTVPYAFGEWDDVVYVTQKGAALDILMTVVDAGAYQISAWYSGWHMPASLFNQLYYGITG